MQYGVGKILGMILGFASAGFRGALLGFLIGYLYDNRTQGGRGRRFARNARSADKLSENLVQSTYAIGAIVLGAKLAKSDGRVSRAEIAAFRSVFHIDNSQVDEVGRLFDQARKSSGGYEPYAARLAQVFHNNSAVLEEILAGLFVVAIADSVSLTPPEDRFLRRVAVIFGFSEADFDRIAARAGVPLPNQSVSKKNEDYALLGLPENASNAEIKRTYRALIRKHHPDKLAAQGLSPELQAQATEKMKRINAAYDSLCKARGIK